MEKHCQIKASYTNRKPIYRLYRQWELMIRDSVEARAAVFICSWPEFGSGKLIEKPLPDWLKCSTAAAFICIKLNIAKFSCSTTSRISLCEYNASWMHGSGVASRVPGSILSVGHCLFGVFRACMGFQKVGRCSYWRCVNGPLWWTLHPIQGVSPSLEHAQCSWDRHRITSSATLTKKNCYWIWVSEAWPWNSEPQPDRS